MQEEQQGQALGPLHQMVEEAARPKQPSPKQPSPKQPNAEQPTAEQPTAEQPTGATTQPSAREPQGSPAPIADPPGTFYTYVDGAGVSHIVDSPLRIPAKHQHTAQRWVTSGAADQGTPVVIPQGLTQLAKQITAPTPTAPWVGPIHGPSVLLGVTGAAATFLVFTLLRRRTTWLMRMIAVMVVAALGGAAYLGWVRRQAGLGADALSNPGAALLDAQRAAQKLESRNQQHREMLDTIATDPSITPTR